jgi:hypothetical protein
MLSNIHGTVMPWYNHPLGWRPEGMSGAQQHYSRVEPLPLNCLLLPWQLSAARLFGARGGKQIRGLLAASCRIWLLSSLIRMETLYHESWIAVWKIPPLPSALVIPDTCFPHREIKMESDHFSNYYLISIYSPFLQSVLLLVNHQKEKTWHMMA